MIPGSGSVIFLLFVLVTVPIISNKFLKVYRLTQEKKYKCSILICTFFFCRRTADNYFLFLIEKEFL